ncbi:MAG: fused MFS/spermidine synthase [Phycisphaerales bacterium]|nr:MAG: fused MFS/spermidine synthase [Phycisphaerales bacterium]
MDGPDEKAVAECAASLSSLLTGSDGKKRLSPDGQRKMRKNAVSSLRDFDDEALLATLHRLHQAGKSETLKQTKRKTDKKRESRIIPSTRRRTGVFLWLATATLAGAIVMGMEIAAFRLYAPYLGYSIYVWGTMISVVMGALALGYALGGWLADRSRSDKLLYALVLISAAYQLIIIFTVRSFLPALSELGDFLGTAVATLIVFAPPMAGLATVGPFVIRLLTRAGHAGSTAGQVYALSTAGSIAGILLTSFVVIPRLGTQAALEISCAASALLGIAGIVRGRRFALAALLPLAALPFSPEPSWGTSTVAVSESAYNLVRVVREGTQLMLILNDEASVATRQETNTGWTGGYYDDFALGPLLVPAHRALVLGMGAGGSISSMRATAPDIEIDAVEIDPEVVAAAFRHFGLDRNDERLRIHVADARPWVARNAGQYDIVQIDLYQGGPYIPFYLCTLEFFESVRKHMTDGGLLMMNVLDAGEHLELLSSAVATLKQVFPSVAVFSRPTGNHMVLASSQRRSVEHIRKTLAEVEGEDVTSRHARRVASVVVDFVTTQDTPVFTDDLAPIEAMTKRMMETTRTATSISRSR